MRRHGDTQQEHGAQLRGRESPSSDLTALKMRTICCWASFSRSIFFKSLYAFSSEDNAIGAHLP